MKYTNIYLLEDPTTDQIRYVGKANDPKERLKNHLNPCKKHTTHKWNWLNSLRKKGLKPNLIIIDKVLIKEWQFWEKYWIEQFSAWGFNLTNYMRGGQGTTFANQTSFKKGHIPWNLGKTDRIVKICPICSKEFEVTQSVKDDRKHCSRKCYAEYQKNNSNSGMFEEGFTPWNKNNSGYTLKGNTVYQYSKDKQTLISSYMSCAEAARKINGNQSAISACCRGESKSSSGFYWSYKKL